MEEVKIGLLDNDGLDQTAPSKMIEGVKIGLLDNDGLDDDGRPKRTGTFWTVSAHIVTTVVGSGVLSLPWAIAQLGWLFGTIALLLFSAVTIYGSIILADAYRFSDPITGRRNYTYSQVIQQYLGISDNILSAIVQYIDLVGHTVGYIITSSSSIAAIQRSQCFHKHGHASADNCQVSIYSSTIVFGAIQLLMSQIPNLGNLSKLSVLTSMMCFSHASIGLGLSIAKVLVIYIYFFNKRGQGPTNLLTVVPIGEKLSIQDKLWNSFTALGDLAFAYGFSHVLIEIQDTLRSPPAENRIMKQASTVGISIATVFYLLYGLLGHAAFGTNAPENFLTGFGSFEPFWLVNLANICIVVHLIGTYQICAQPIFGFVENLVRTKWPNSKLNEDLSLGNFNFNIFRLVWRTTYVGLTTILALMFPFLNNVVGIIGAISFWPLTIYFPFKMHMERLEIEKFSSRWVMMQILSLICLVTSIVAVVGCVGGIIKSMKNL